MDFIGNRFFWKSPRAKPHSDIETDTNNVPQAFLRSKVIQEARKKVVSDFG